jgi:hypothetical protein
VDHTFSSFGGLWGTLKAMVFNTYANPAAARKLERSKPGKSGGSGDLPLPVLAGNAA